VGIKRAEYWIKRGETMASRGMFKEALDYFERSLFEDPSSMTARVNIWKVYLLQKEREMRREMRFRDS